ncbi:MAG: SPASM domain-containing protein [Monoglobus pectinilyticus]
MLDEIKLYSYQITLDGCKEQHNKSRVRNYGDNTYDTIINNVRLLEQALPKSQISIRVNFTNKTLENIKGLIDDLPKSDRISFCFQRIWQSRETEGESNAVNDDIKLYIETRGNQFENNYFDYGKKYRCYADSCNQIVINYDGKLYKCTACDFEKDSKACVGELQDDGIPIWNKSYYERLKIPFDNTKCKNCILAPVCFGTCSQHFYSGNFDASECNPSEKIKILKEDLYESLFEYISKHTKATQ